MGTSGSSGPVSPTVAPYPPSTDHPSDASGVAVPGLPVGTAFVRIVGTRVDADGSLQVRLPGEGSDVVSVDARLLGVH